MPGLREFLDSLLNGTREQSVPSQVRERRSPLGVRELVVPPEAESMFFREPGVMASTFMHQSNLPKNVWAPYIAYKERHANNPMVTQHERIHAGQNLLDRQPSDKEIERIWGRALKQLIGGSDFFGSSEVPAYEFQRGRMTPEKRKLFAAYLDLVNRLNANKGETLEMAMPENLIRDYVKNHPAPVAPPKVIK